MAKPTPGPWTADLTGSCVYANADPYGHGPMRIADTRGWGHLTGAGSCAFDDATAVAIQLANARLLAAAPELLEALKWALKVVRIPLATDPEEWARHYNDAQALVKRIEEG